MISYIKNNWFCSERYLDALRRGVSLEKSAPGLNPTQIIFRTVVWENEYFILGRICNGNKFLLDYRGDLSLIMMGKSPGDSLLISGWSANEGEFRWSDSQYSTIRLVRSKNKNISSLAILVRAIAEPQSVTIYLNDKIIGKQKLNTMWSKYNFSLPSNVDTDLMRFKFVFFNIYKPAEFKQIWLE